MMTSSFVLYALVGLTSTLVLVQPKYVPPAATPPTDEYESPRVELLGGGSNYTVSFVPLFTVIANLIPKIIGRIQAMRQPTQTTTGKAINYREPRSVAQYQEIPCSEDTLGLWPDAERTDIFHDCQLSCPHHHDDLKASKHKHAVLLVARPINECLHHRTFQCYKNFMYSIIAKKCRLISNVKSLRRKFAQ